MEPKTVQVIDAPKQGKCHRCGCAIPDREQLEAVYIGPIELGPVVWHKFVNIDEYYCPGCNEQFAYSIFRCGKDGVRNETIRP